MVDRRLMRGQWLELWSHQAPTMCVALSPGSWTYMFLTGHPNSQVRVVQASKYSLLVEKLLA